LEKVDSNEYIADGPKMIDIRPQASDE
jgi:hypothetical protein